MQADYSEYRNLSSEEKERRIEEAEQEEKYRAPNPQADHVFP